MTGVRRDNLDPIIDELIARRLRGESVDETTLNSEFGDHAADLLPILAKLDRIDRARVRALSEAPADAAVTNRRGGSDWKTTENHGPLSSSSSSSSHGNAGLDAGDLPGADSGEGLADPGNDFFSPSETTFPTIGKEYVVLREISRGGQAIVYLARRESDQRLLALKVLRDGTLADERQRRRFEHEATVLARLSHPNLLALVARGTTGDGHDWIATPFVDGDMLDPAAIAKARPLQERLALFVTICRAVQAAHAADVIHRDLKPSNIRFDRAGRPIVLDFGLARSADATFRQSMTQTGQFLGTFFWASPEQARGEAEISSASDVYSLGVILHQLIADGQFPPQVYDTIRRAIDGNAVVEVGRPARFTAVSQPALRIVLTTALATDPAQRHPNAGALADAVEAAAGGLDARIDRPWVRRVGIGALVLTAGFAFWQFRNGTLGKSPLPPGAKDPSTVAEPTIRVNRPNSLGMLFSRIPAGRFVMGSPATELSRFLDEKQHEAVIDKPFMMSVYETTQQDFQSLMGYNPSKFKGDRLPVEMVSWDEAVEFCKRLSAKESKTYRLPTETEWEYACRAGSANAWSFGNDPELAPRYANYADRSIPRGKESEPTDDGAPYTETVGRYIPNAWGLLDMHGNVWEWTGSVYVADPTTQRSGDGPTSSADSKRVAKGGSWYDMLPSHRSANRNPLRADLKNDNLGFRVVCEEAD